MSEYKRERDRSEIGTITVRIDKASGEALDNILGRQLEEGRNRLGRSDSGLELVVRATPGELLEYLIIDRNGDEVDEIHDVQVTYEKKATTCWKCGVDKAGDTHCWVVPCPDIVGPWKPGKVLSAGFAWM